ncbi:MAG: hypothetical protein IPN17_09290 [Deltaproteobacteria bacterium]|nr:hypothetical protein [Deltaproteobacteria bacterium]
MLMLSVGDAMVPQKVPPQESLHEPMHARVGMSPLMTMRVRRLIALGSAKLRSSAPVVGSESAMLQRPDGQTMARPTLRFCDTVGTGMPPPTRPPRRPGAMASRRLSPFSERRTCAARGMRVSGASG